MRLNNLASDYAGIWDYENAIELETEALDIVRNVSGVWDSDYASILNNLSTYCYYFGDYDKAIELETETMEIRKEVLDERDSDYALTLSNLCEFYAALGDYDRAIEFGTKAVETQREIHGERNPDYALSLSNLAGHYSDFGYDDMAIELGTEALEIQREVLGDMHPEYATSLANLASYYSDQGNYDKAIELGTEAAAIRKEVLGDRNPYYANSLSGLSTYCFFIGNYGKAIELGLETLDIEREVLGNMHPNYATSLHNMAVFLNAVGEYDSALECETEALNIRKEVLGERHPDYLSSLNSLAILYEGIGNFDAAIDLGIQVVDIIGETLGRQHPNYTTALHNLGNYYDYSGDFDKAIELGTESLQIMREFWGDRHPYYSITLNDLSESYRKVGDLDRALEEKRLSKKVYAENLRNNFSFLTANGRSLYWDKIEWGIESGTVYCVIYPTDGSNELAYDIELLGKGILLSSEREFDKVIKESGNEELLAKFEQLRQDRLQLEEYYNNPVDERPADEVARLEKEAEQLEKDLIAGSKEYGDFTKSLAIEWADVRGALRDSDVAIEFAKVEADSTDYYVALMLRKGWDAPKCVNLGTAESFEPYLAMINNELYRSQEFSEKVWGAIVESANLQEGDNVYFAPDGIFYQLGIEYLPIDKNNIMADKYNLRRLSSTKELCFEPGVVAEDSAVLYGGLEYEVKSESPQTSDNVVASAVGSSSEEGASGVEVAMAQGSSEVASGAETDGTMRDLTVGRLLAERGAEADSLMRDNIKYLPGTLAEADTLATMLAQKEIAYKKYTGYKGTEESFKALTGNSPRLIHIATHGFYLSPTSAEIMSQREGGFKAGGFGGNDDATDLSMSRAGLLFAGAGPAWFGEAAPEDGDDGILTAKEIAGLDLRGTDLTVLSACSTASGEITGDGVAGLQRGFKKAGVKTLLLTLWEVNDRATQLFMTKFYENLTNGKSKRQAFDAAQSYLRTFEDWIEYEIDDPDGEPVYDDTIGDWVRPTKTVRELGRPYAAPQYWAAFIMLD